MVMVTIALVFLWNHIVSVSGQSCFIPLSGFKFCAGSQRHLITGKFDGTERDSILCHDDKTGEMSILNMSTTVKYNINNNFCTGSSVLSADLNGDGKSDLICSTTLEYLLNNDGGRFENETLRSLGMKFCDSENDTLLVGDVNNNKQDDLICHHKEGHFSFIVFNKKSFLRMEGSSERWCHRKGDKMNLGDYNGDGNIDLFCISPKTNQAFIVFSTDSAIFGEIGWSETTNFCNKENSLLLTGDINGDGIDDFICNDLQQITIKKNRLTKQGLSSFEMRPFPFCLSGGKRFFLVADFDGDGWKDIMCHPDNGFGEISLSRCD